MLDFETSKPKSEVSKFVENYFFLENYVTSKGVVFHVLYHQQLSINRYQARFYANNYFENYQ